MEKEMDKPIEELLNEEVAISEKIETYSTETVAMLIKQSVDIHWQQAMELTGQSVHLTRWGYGKLGSLFGEYAKEEHVHAGVAISRLEFFDEDYQPLTVSPRLWKRHDIKSIIEFNLEGVRNAALVEKAVIKLAREVGDEITAQEFIPLLKGSDDGILEFEKMLKTIEQMGIENFLTLVAEPLES
jgi:bacterioferritin (cytochrome b1)